jgi:transcriptional regulator with XRE-family HTH domain
MHIKDIMISIFPMTPYEMMWYIAKQAKLKRLSLNLTQRTLAEQSGVSYGSLKIFERSGQISLESLLKIALILNDMDSFKQLFTMQEDFSMSLDELIKNDKTRKRGSK